MILTYVGRRMATTNKPAAFYLDESDPAAEPIGFAKPPAMAKNWPVGTRFEVDHEPGSSSYRFDARVGSSSDDRVAEWIIEDRVVETIVETERIRKGAKAGETEAIDDLTVRELRALLAKQLPSRRRAMLAIVIDRLS